LGWLSFKMVLASTMFDADGMVCSRKWDVEGDDGPGHCPGDRICLDDIGLDDGEHGKNFDGLPQPHFMQSGTSFGVGNCSADKVGDTGAAGLARTEPYFLSHLIAWGTKASPDWVGPPTGSHRGKILLVADAYATFWAVKKT
jgi:hypothetical protein